MDRFANIVRRPVFWVPRGMAFGRAVVVQVTSYHLFHPGKALLQP